MDKLRACIVANYYASAGLLKVSEVSAPIVCFQPPFSLSEGKSGLCGFPAIQTFLILPLAFDKPGHLSEEHRSSGNVFNMVLSFLY
jgi:hypothetical protein